MEKVLQLGGQQRQKVGPARVDDTLLIREAQQGNATAFEELVRQYDRAVLRLAVHMTGSRKTARTSIRKLSCVRISISGTSASSARSTPGSTAS